MKFYFYEVRPDERPYLDRHAAAHPDVTFCYTDAVPSLETAELANGFDGVSILGQGVINRELLQLWKNCGVRAVSTRTSVCPNSDDGLFI